MPHRVAQKCNVVHDFANNAARSSKTYQASRGLSAIAELIIAFIFLFFGTFSFNLEQISDNDSN